RSPIDTSFVLGTFACAGPGDVDRAVESARSAQRAWSRLPWRERLKILEQAAEIIRERKYELAAIMTLEVGKRRLEAMGDAEGGGGDGGGGGECGPNGGLLRPGRRRGRVRPSDGTSHPGRTEHRRPSAIRRVRLHCAVQLPARPVGGDVVRRARRRQRGGVQA